MYSILEINPDAFKEENLYDREKNFLNYMDIVNLWKEAMGHVYII